MDTYFFDTTGVVAGTKKRESDGALLADVRIARTGIQLYRGSEVDKNNDHGFKDKAVVRVYRPGEEVFAEDTRRSATHRPVTNDHPPEMVNADNWSKYAKGNTADEVSAEGIFLRVPLMVSDGATIKDIESGKREVSAGYWSTMDWTPGKTADGEDYDAVQRNIRFNHIAVVRRGRAGPQVRIGDAEWGASPVEDGEDEGVTTMADKPLKTVTVDGLSIETTDQGAQVIEKLQSQIKSLNDTSAAALAAHATALADKDKQLAQKDGEIAELKKQVLDAAGLDARVSARATLIENAKKVAPAAKFDGLDDAGIKKLAVKTAFGDAAVADKSDAYIDARFDVALEAAGKGSKDTFRSALKDGLENTATLDKATTEARTAYEEQRTRLQDAWKGTTETAKA